MKNKIKQIITTGSVFIVMLFAFSNCKKTDTTTTTTTPGTTTNPYYFSCKVNGVFTDFKNMTLVKNDTINPQIIFLVGGVSAQNTPPILNFTLNKKSAWIAGLSYKLDYNDNDNFAIYKNLNLDEFKSTAIAATQGGVTISFSALNIAKNGVATGTFAGSLQLEQSIDKVVITEGKFNVKFMN